MSREQKDARGGRLSLPRNIECGSTPVLDEGGHALAGLIAGCVRQETGCALRL